MISNKNGKTNKKRGLMFVEKEIKINYKKT
jgi:hypothetical protein